MDFDVVDGGVAALHEAGGGEFPVFVPVAAKPLPSGIVPFVFEADGDAVVGEGPEFFHQAVVEFFGPFLGEEGDDGVGALEELVAVAPVGVGGIAAGDAGGVAGVPGGFGHFDFLEGGFAGEGGADVGGEEGRVGHEGLLLFLARGGF